MSTLQLSPTDTGKVASAQNIAFVHIQRGPWASRWLFAKKRGDIAFALYLAVELAFPSSPPPPPGRKLWDFVTLSILWISEFPNPNLVEKLLHFVTLSILSFPNVHVTSLGRKIVRLNHFSTLAKWWRSRYSAWKSSLNIIRVDHSGRSFGLSFFLLVCTITKSNLSKLYQHENFHNLFAKGQAANKKAVAKKRAVSCGPVELAVRLASWPFGRGGGVNSTVAKKWKLLPTGQKSFWWSFMTVELPPPPMANSTVWDHEPSLPAKFEVAAWNLLSYGDGWVTPCTKSKMAAALCDIYTP